MSSPEKIFRPSSRYWKRELGVLVLFFIVCPVSGMLYFGSGEMYFAGGLTLIVGIPYLISEFRAAHRQQMTFSRSGIVVKVREEEFRLSWESIRAVRFVGQAQSRCLVLYCDEQSLNISCRFYDETELMENLKKHLSPGVLHPQAYQKLPEFLGWQAHVLQELAQLNRPLKVPFGRTEKWIGILGVGLGALFIVLYCFSQVDLFSAVTMFGLFGGLGLLVLVLCIGWMEADNHRISIRSPFRKYTLLWSDLREIYINSSQDVLALVGEDSRLIVPASSGWSGKDKELLSELIHLKIELSNLEPIESAKPLYWLSKNA